MEKLKKGEEQLLLLLTIFTESKMVLILLLTIFTESNMVQSIPNQMRIEFQSIF
jgi:hypothetical protein